eukprot:jgi/Mesen1/4923/ME000246S04148
MAVDAAPEAVQELRRRLLDVSSPIARRFRALFSLRNLRGAEPRDALIAALEDESCLLAHEAAFALGQMQDPAAVPALKHVLQEPSYHPMVRHEAAEALGAIGMPECLALLTQALADPAPEVRETCQLALKRIQHSLRSQVGGAQEHASSLETETAGSGHEAAAGENEAPAGRDGPGQQQQQTEIERSPFMSVDPAPAAAASVATADLRALLLADGADMYERYSAMFALRNRGGRDAVDALVAALASAASALLRHEVAYVLGQLQDRAAADALVRVLADAAEHPMVRHEAAEALGSIADTESIALLKEYQRDPEPIVAQSCDVALDMLHFELQDNAFQYADVDVPSVTAVAAGC